MDLDEEFQKKRDFVEEYRPLTKETYGDLVEEFQKKRDFVEEYTPLTKDTCGNFTKMESLDVMSTNDDNTLGFTLELYSRYMDAAKLQKAKDDAEEAYNSISDAAKEEMIRYNRQRVLCLQASLIQYAESRLKNGRDTYAILAKLLNDMKKSS